MELAYLVTYKQVGGAGEDTQVDAAAAAAFEMRTRLAADRPLRKNMLPMTTEESGSTLTNFRVVLIPQTSDLPLPRH